ncbi:hypothetical protein [Kitasatospora cineracea]|uniref:hypothetical protein n=1 Tax=Kitasatospora cineracea TaxID=88074 RepID=UPI0036BFC767
MDRPQKPGRPVGGQLGRGASWQKIPQQRMELVDGADPGLSQVDAPFALAPAAPTDATVCKGDAGGPVWRTENGKPALAGVVSRSWQGGCLGTPAGETRTGAYATRTDDVVGWVQGVRSRTIEIKPGTHLFAIGSEGSTYGLDVNYTTGVWGTGWTRPDGTSLKAITSTVTGNTAHIYAVNEDTKLYTRDANYDVGWGNWNSSGRADQRSVRATAARHPRPSGQRGPVER